MRKLNLLSLLVIASSVICLTSYENGPARHSGYDCSGSESDFGNQVGCSVNSGCHGTAATSGIAITIEVDTAGGGPVSGYRGGGRYTVKLTGTNNTTNTDGYFGFQMTAITGSSRVVTPANAGTWQQSGLPANVQYTRASPGHFLANVIEQSNAIPATSGSGGAGTIYSETIGWTAPPKGTGTVSFWAALNAVDGIDVATGFLDFWNTQSLVLEEDTGADVTSAINSLSDKMIVNIYPNPATDFVQVEMNSAAPGLWYISAYDADGRKVSATTMESTGNIAKTILQTSGWAEGIYLLNFTKGQEQKIVRVLKK